MSITLMTRYQIENKKTKYKYALYGGLQNKNKEPKEPSSFAKWNRSLKSPQ